MKNLIIKVLKDVADMQLNLESKAAQEFLADKIESAILKEIQANIKK